MVESETEYSLLVVIGMAGLVALVDVWMVAGVELEELEVVVNGFVGGLGGEKLGIDGGVVGSTEGSDVVVTALSTDEATLATLDNTTGGVNGGT